MRERLGVWGKKIGAKCGIRIGIQIGDQKRFPTPLFPLKISS